MKCHVVWLTKKRNYLWIDYLLWPVCKQYLTFYFQVIFRFINIKIFLKKKFPKPIWSQHEYSEYISENLACVLNYIF